MFGGTIVLNTPMLFANGFIFLFTFGGLTGIVFDMRSIQWNEVISFMQLHQTRYIYKFISADNKRISGSSDVLSRGSGAIIKKSKNKSEVSIV